MLDTVKNIIDFRVIETELERLYDKTVGRPAILQIVVQVV